MRLPRLTTRWSMITVAAIILSVTWLVLPYKAIRYRGDGAITDRGFWSYPRYRIQLPQVELTANRTRLFKLTGLPPVPLTLELEVIDRRLVDPKDYDLLRRMSTTVSVKIADVHGRTVCSASGPLKDWVLTQGFQSAGYWHPNCREVRFHEDMSYTMTVAVGGESSDSPLVIVPTMQGGGNELF
jgi:hypothetical protein